MEALLLLGLFLLLITLGAPIAYVMIAIPAVYIVVTGALPINTIPYQIYESIARPPLVAIPFFLLTGELMNSAKITDRLVTLSRELVGRLRGGLAQINVLVSMLFAGMNGSAVADSAVIGSLLIPAMKKAGYSPSFAAAITAVSSTIGGIIPPSILMILLATNVGLSVGGLFAGGILPGILIGVGLMFLCYGFAVIRGYEKYEEKFTVRALFRAFVGATLPLCIPAVLVGGIVFGVFGTTEAGAITALLAAGIGALVYRSLTWEEFFKAIYRAIRNSASVFLIIAAAGPFGWMLNRLGALDFLENWLLSFVGSPLLFVVVVILFIILAGMVMDVVANVVILGPTLMAVMVSAGYDEIQAAVIVCIGFLIGLCTPPVGIAYFTTAAIADVRLERLAITIIPFVLVEIIILAVIFQFEGLVLWLPSVFGFG